MWKKKQNQILKIWFNISKTRRKSNKKINKSKINLDNTIKEKVEEIQKKLSFEILK